MRDQKKKPKITSHLCSSPRVSGQTGQKAISLRCQNIRPGNAIAFNSSQTLLFVTHAKSVSCRQSPNSTKQKNGGARRDRTDDILLAKQALSQLSYGPIFFVTEQFMPKAELVGPGRLELPTSRLSGVRSNHLSYGPPDAVWTGPF